MNIPDISIVLINHNAAKLTLDCLKSILKITSLSYEIILVDNASTDDSVEMIKSSFLTVKLFINRLNVGFSRANNQGIKLARGKYLLLLNNDTELINDSLTMMVRFLDNSPKVGIVTCKLLEPNGTVQKNCRSFPITPLDTIFGRASLLSRLFPNNPVTKRTVLSEWDYNSRRKIDWVSGAAMMIRREMVDQIGLLDENYFMYWEDTDFCKRAGDVGWEIWYIPEGEIIHYTGKGGGRRSIGMQLYTMFQMHRSAYYYFRKYYYPNPLHPMAVLTVLGMIILLSIKSLGLIVGQTFRILRPARVTLIGWVYRTIDSYLDYRRLLRLRKDAL